MLERILPKFREEVIERFARHLEDEQMRTIRGATRAFGGEPLSTEPGNV